LKHNQALGSLEYVFIVGVLKVPLTNFKLSEESTLFLFPFVMQIRFRDPDEYLEQIEGSYGLTPALRWNGKSHDVVNGTAATTVGRENHFTVISSLTFKSNKETYGPYGVTGDTPFKTDVGKIVGIFGRAGTCLDRIGVFIRRPEVII
jgi:hypothetical protein